jgi:hypothetical protein
MKEGPAIFNLARTKYCRRDAGATKTKAIAKNPDTPLLWDRSRKHLLSVGFNKLPRG